MPSNEVMSILLKDWWDVSPLERDIIVDWFFEKPLIIKNVFKVREEEAIDGEE